MIKLDSGSVENGQAEKTGLVPAKEEKTARAWGVPARKEVQERAASVRKEERVKIERTEDTGRRVSFLERIKRIKNIEIYAAVAIILVMVLIYVSTLLPSSDSSSAVRANEDKYARELEGKLVNVLSQIKGAGRVSAMVTVAGSSTVEIAYSTDEKTVTQNGSGGGSSTSTTTVEKSPVIINAGGGAQPFVIYETKPKLKGVIIVAAGAWDIGVRLQLLRAVQTLVSDADVSIEIFTGK